MSGSIKPYTCRGKTAYRVRFYFTDPDTGKTEQKSKSGFRTKKEADTFLTEINHQLQTNTYNRETRITVENYLEAWLKEHVQPELKQNTIISHTKYLKNHVIPRLGQIRLQRLNTSHLRQFYRDLQVKGRVRPTRDGRKSLSQTTLRQIRAILNKALADAVGDGLISKHPGTYAKLPKPIDQKPTRVGYYTLEQFRALLDAVKGTKCELPVLLAGAMGLRRGEILGLRWSDVDLKNGILTIQQTLNINQNRECYIDTPKSEKSKRVLMIPAELIPLFRQRRQVISISGKDDSLVFVDEIGHPINPDSFSRGFADFLEKNQLPPIRFHDLRHTYASLLIEHGHNVKAVSETLGHSNITTTLNIYTHVTQDGKRKIAESMDCILKGAK